ncbi:hypothetical protein [Pediococcus pentosaceus]|uniref:XRE family transcriptional regulator n=1 Tax=Pediococcus pentosaceus TaxID=1255 RepID=A0A1Y0W1L7_PEDPE|nr:hypothetical protein [Pediococcus pentosaceus]ARW20637.1 hypothetical protein S100892_02102 [Pediococcus pentosaceus]UQB00848.1 hypothetical protein Ped0941_00615 [Pediococcus pentosaceus]UQB02696.1 hypothetical protein Ped0620_00610 [Pediococcus pentosaceus]
MDYLKEYLEENGTTQYKVSKNQKVPFTTLSDASRKPIENWKVKIIIAIAHEVNKTAGQVLDELNAMDK